MKLLLIAPPVIIKGPAEGLPLDPIDSTEFSMPQLSVYALCSLLESKGHNVDIIEIGGFSAFMHDFENVVLRYDMLGMTANSFNWPVSRRIICELGKYKDRPLMVVGGIHPTYYDMHIAETTPVDFVIRSEGDYALLDLMDALAGRRTLESVPNLTWKRPTGSAGCEIVRNEESSLLTPDQLNHLPDHAIKRIPAGVYSELPLESSRGCLFSCVFCSIQFRSNWRTFSLPQIFNRVQQAVAQLHKFRNKVVFFTDDCFSTDVNRVAEICEYLEHEVDHAVQFMFEARVTDLLKGDSLERMARARPYQIQVGIEAGYDSGLRKVGKGLTCEQVERFAAKAKELGIIDNIKFGYIVGFPWEGQEEVNQTLRFSSYIQGQYGGLRQIVPLIVTPGTRLLKYPDRFGMVVKPEKFDNFGWHKDAHYFRETHTQDPDVWNTLAETQNKYRRHFRLDLVEQRLYKKFSTINED